MSRTTLLREQRDWTELQGAAGWLRLEAKAHEDIKDLRLSIESGETPDGPGYARKLGRLDVLKVYFGDDATGMASWPESRVRELERELKEQTA